MAKRFELLKTPTGAQMRFLKCPADEVLFGGALGGGKGLKASEVIATPYGFRELGTLRVGDTISSSDGGTQKILAYHRRGVLPFYRITFSDGVWIDCDEDHIWVGSLARTSTKHNGESSNGYERKWVTKDLYEHYKTSSKRIGIPTISEPIRWTVAGEFRGNSNFIKREIDAYTLGVLIGDGCLTGKDIRFFSADEEIANKIKQVYHVSSRAKKGTSCRAYRLPSALKKPLEDLGLLGKYSKEKFIPRIYKFGTIEERYELLRGLLDTDGWCEEDGGIYYCSISKQLVEDVAFVARSLGCIVSIRSKRAGYKKDGEYIECNRAYTAYIKTNNGSSLFTLERKKNNCIDKQYQTMKRWIKSIEQIEPSESICITVSNANSLFVTKDFTVTHNSTASVILAYILGMKTAGLVIGLFRKTLPELSNTLIQEALETYPKGSYVYKEAKRKMYLINGSELRFNYIATDSDLIQYQGQEFDLMIFDEAGEFTEYQLIRIKERLRTSKPIRTKICYLTNPRGAGKGYLKRRFIDGKLPNKLYLTPETIGLDKQYQRYLCYIPARITENKYLYENDPSYVHSLKELSEEEYKALVLGDWDSKLGTFFPQWTNDLIIPTYTPQATDQLFLSMDWGTAKPFCVQWFAYTITDEIIMYREYYGSNGKPDIGLNLTSSQVAKEIIKRCPDGEEYRYLVLDSACWSKQGNGKSIYEELQENLRQRKISIIPANKERKNGWENMKNWLNSGKFKVTNDCKNFIRTIPDMIYNSKLDDMEALEDHSVDCCRYLLSSRPRKRNIDNTITYSPEQCGYYYNLEQYLQPIDN